jgi:putative chitinase
MGSIAVALSILLGDAMAARWSEPIDIAMEKWGLTTDQHYAYFMANALHESGGLVSLEENLNYSASRLLQVWPSRFTPELAAQVARKPQEIAEIVYGGRMGNTEPGDGWKYRGHGIFQLTGKDNHSAYARASGRDVVKDPSLLLKPDAAADSACWYWNSRKLNAFANVGDFAGVVYRINGGYNGLDDRKAWLKRIEDAQRDPEAPPDTSGMAEIAMLYDLTSKDAWAILWATLRGEREVSLDGDWVWRAAPASDGSKIMLRRDN